MRCHSCKANEFEAGKAECLAGIVPQIPKKSGVFGCSCNGQQVDGYLHKSVKTNADRIRAMSDEELAKWLVQEAAQIINAPSWCKGACEDDYNCPHELKCALDWLSQPAEEE